MQTNENTVEVNFHFELIDKSSESRSEFHEQYTMRYFFVPGLLLALQTARLELLAVTEWMSDREPGQRTWN